MNLRLITQRVGADTLIRVAGEHKGVFLLQDIEPVWRVVALFRHKVGLEQLPLW